MRYVFELPKGRGVVFYVQLQGVYLIQDLSKVISHWVRAHERSLVVYQNNKDSNRKRVKRSGRRTFRRTRVASSAKLRQSYSCFNFVLPVSNQSIIPRTPG